MVSRADMTLNLINRLYGIEREYQDSGDRERHVARQQRSLPILEQLKAWLDKTQPQVTAQNALGKAQLYSLIETAKANGREPYTWLRYILERLPAANSIEDFEALLPWNCPPTNAS